MSVFFSLKLILENIKERTLVVKQKDIFLLLAPVAFYLYQSFTGAMYFISLLKGMHYYY